MKQIYIVLALFAVTAIHAQEVIKPLKPTKFGNGILNLKGQDDTWSLKFGARMQMVTNNNWTYDKGNLSDYQSSALVRRVRLKFDGYAYSPKLQYKLEMGFSNHDLSGADAVTKDAPRAVLDAVVKWNFYKNMSVWYGQTKLPGNIERVISSGNLQFVDRSLLNGEFTLDREFGTQLRNHHTIGSNFVMREKLAITQGDGRNVTVNNFGGHMYTGRLELLPMGLFKGNGDYKASDMQRELKPKLMIGLTYCYNLNASKEKGNQGTFFSDIDPSYKGLTSDVKTFFFDGMFKYNGYSVMWEYANRGADLALVRIGNGLNIQGGYLFHSNWEVAARFTNIYIDNVEQKDELTLALSRYVVGHKLKVQFDAGYNEIITLTNNSIIGSLACRLQVEVHL